MTGAERRAQWLAGQTCAAPVERGLCGSTDRLQAQVPAPFRGEQIWQWSRARLGLIMPGLHAFCWAHHYDALVARRGMRRATHGTRSMYRRGCRCQACHDNEAAHKRAAYVRKSTRRSPQRPGEETP